jgi:hypothetical protein
MFEDLFKDTGKTADEVTTDDFRNVAAKKLRLSLPEDVRSWTFGKYVPPL